MNTYFTLLIQLMNKTITNIQHKFIPHKVLEPQDVWARYLWTTFPMCHARTVGASEQGEVHWLGLELLIFLHWNLSQQKQWIWLYLIAIDYKESFHNRDSWNICKYSVSSSGPGPIILNSLTKILLCETGCKFHLFTLANLGKFSCSNKTTYHWKRF